MNAPDLADYLESACRAAVGLLLIASVSLLIAAAVAFYRRRRWLPFIERLLICLALALAWSQLAPRLDPLMVRLQDALSTDIKPPAVRTWFDI